MTKINDVGKKDAHIEIQLLSHRAHEQFARKNFESIEYSLVHSAHNHYAVSHLVFDRIPCRQ